MTLLRFFNQHSAFLAALALVAALEALFGAVSWPLVPATDRLERRYDGHLRVQRLDVMDVEGTRARRELGLQLVPAYVLLDAAGEERWRENVPMKPAKLRAVGV